VFCGERSREVALDSLANFKKAKPLDILLALPFARRARKENLSSRLNADAGHYKKREGRINDTLAAIQLYEFANLTKKETIKPAL
jgi:hypothetical protein